MRVVCHHAHLNFLIADQMVVSSIFILQVRVSLQDGISQDAILLNIFCFRHVLHGAVLCKSKVSICFTQKMKRLQAKTFKFHLDVYKDCTVRISKYRVQVTRLCSL